MEIRTTSEPISPVVCDYCNMHTLLETNKHTKKLNVIGLIAQKN